MEKSSSTLAASHCWSFIHILIPWTIEREERKWVKKGADPWTRRRRRRRKWMLTHMLQLLTIYPSTLPAFLTSMNCRPKANCTLIVTGRTLQGSQNGAGGGHV